ncbi:hypothetical protein OAX78_03860, partial [Planctomycetota bacterium]|nr:hypothetical protein [Planctomycetota bacterium]
MIATTISPLAHEIVTKARATHERMLARLPFYQRLMDGSATRDEYASWLVQMHKYVRYSVPGYLNLARALAACDGSESLREYASWEAEEESGHDELILGDLASLWGVSVNEALGRVERTRGAPAVTAWTSQRDSMMHHHPKGIMGMALTLETIASLQADMMRAALTEAGTIE